MIKRCSGFLDPSFFVVSVFRAPKRKDHQNHRSPQIMTKWSPKSPKINCSSKNCRRFNFFGPFFSKEPQTKKKIRARWFKQSIHKLDPQTLGWSTFDLAIPTFCRNCQLEQWPVHPCWLFYIGDDILPTYIGHCNQPTFPGSLLTTTRSISFQCQESFWLFTLLNGLSQPIFVLVFQGIWP